jgi:hypothetical protein
MSYPPSERFTIPASDPLLHPAHYYSVLRANLSCSIDSRDCPATPGFENWNWELGNWDSLGFVDETLSTPQMDDLAFTQRVPRVAPSEMKGACVAQDGSSGSIAVCKLTNSTS